MMDNRNPFSPDYVPQLDMSDIARAQQQSRQRSKQRDEQMSSPDPVKRMQALRPVYGLGLTVEQRQRDTARQNHIKKAGKL